MEFPVYLKTMDHPHPRTFLKARRKLQEDALGIAASDEERGGEPPMTPCSTVSRAEEVSPPESLDTKAKVKNPFFYGL